MKQEQIEQAAEAYLRRWEELNDQSVYVSEEIKNAFLAGAALTAPSAGVWVKASNPPAKATYVEGRNINGSNRGVKLEWDGENWFILYRGSECKIPKNEVKYYEWYNDESRSASQPGVDLAAAEKHVDKVLEAETTESLNEWMKQQQPSAGVWVKASERMPEKPTDYKWQYADEDEPGIIFVNWKHSCAHVYYHSLGYEPQLMVDDKEWFLSDWYWLDESRSASQPTPPSDGVQGLVEALEKIDALQISGKVNERVHRIAREALTAYKNANP